MRTTNDRKECAIKVRLNESTADYLHRKSLATGKTMSDIVRGIIVDQMHRDHILEQSKKAKFN